MRSLVTLHLRELLSSRAFWLWLALLSVICGVVFLLYLEHYLDQQTEIIKKNIRFGLSDLAILPYLKITTLFSTPVIAGLTANWYRRELNSDFAPLFLSLNFPVWHVICAKSIVLLLITFLMVAMMFVPITVFGCIATISLDLARLLSTALMIWAILFVIGLFSAWLSCRLSGGVWGMFVTLTVLGLSELAARLITEPHVFAEFLRYVSPYYHVYAVANGVISLSNIVYLFSATTICLCLTALHLRRRYLIR